MSQLERVVYIDRMIREYDKVTTAQIIEEFEVDDRTVKRDIVYIRDRLLAPIVYSKKAGGYIYEQVFDLFNMCDERMLLSYIMIKNLLESNNYAPVFSQSILREISALLPRDYTYIKDDVVYEVSEYEPVNEEHFKHIVRAMVKKNVVRFDYEKADGTTGERKLEPMKLIHNNGKWYIAGFDTDKKGLRVFSLSRITNLAKTQDRFTGNIDPKEVNEFVEGSFGIAKSSKVVIATVRFYHPVSIRIKNQIWHKDQKLKTGKNNRGEYIEISLPVGFEDELIGRVLRHGSCGEIVSPANIRDKWLCGEKEDV